MRSLIKKLLLVLGVAVFPATASASDWGCQVLLCLADPRGPTTEAECRPPIHKLWRELAKGRGFPSCAMAGNGAYARVIRGNPYRVCPEGLRDFEGYVALADDPRRVWHARGKYEVSSGDNGTSNRYDVRACVGNLVSTYEVRNFCGGDHDTSDCVPRYTVHVFDRAERNVPQTLRAVEVFIDGKLYTRHHY